MSSGYHPETLGCANYKSMLREYCFNTGRDWDEALPMVLFGAKIGGARIAAWLNLFLVALSNVL